MNRFIASLFESVEKPMTKKKQFNYGDRIARTRRKHEYFGTTEPACSVCGEKRVALLEKHHIAGKDYDPATMILCKNHHALMTEFQKDFPPNGAIRQIP